ncbi:MAG: aminodeoxychorismate synthase component I [Acidimicrobiales bacterium]|nr:aminodeoxychorismate synthase component I [Acidimicrobiales bacterium]
MTQGSVQRALLQFPVDGRRRWLTFETPRDCIVADELRDVPAAMAAAEQAAADGHWVVGMVSYDAGPAFDEAVRAARLRRCPLVSFGIFDGPRPSSAGLDGQPSASGGYYVGPWIPNRSRPAYLTSVRTIRELIAAGETYQVNYTLRLRSSFQGDPLGLFGDLVRAQRASHAAYLDLGDRAVCSASPELFVHRDGRLLTSRPMKGTIGRHPDPEFDALAATHLARSEKDLAENTMIVDMVRNDLSRLADHGSVQVPALHTVETYPTLHTMTSTVTAESDAGLGEIFNALFPAASITGAPKVRTTEIIEALEGDGRGVYTGAIGAIAPDGTMEFNIAIRTVWVDRDRCTAEYGVGGGIVWDSDPQEEWTEVEHKSRVLGRARSDFQLLETMRWTRSDGVLLRDRHVARMAASATHFGFEFNEAGINALLDGFRPTEDKEQRLRLLSAPDGALSLEAQHEPAPPNEPWFVPVDSEPVPSGHEFLFHKTTIREVYDDARARFPEAPDVLLINEVDQVTETTIGNVVLDLDGRLVTPPISSGLLPGTFRAQLLDDGTIAEKALAREDLYRADSVWMVNSVRGWVRIVPLTDPSLALRVESQC